MLRTMDKNEKHDWTTLLCNTERISSLFSFCPNLSSVTLHEVKLTRDGSQASIRFDLSELPEPLPSKWQEQEYNTVQLELALLETTKLHIEGWSHQVGGKLHLEKTESCIMMSFQSQKVRFSFQGEYLRLVKISAYENSVP